MNKKLRIILTLLCVAALRSYGQAPQQFNYQGALRNSDGSAVTNRSVSLRLSILDGSDQGSSQYSETRTVTTSSLGIYTVAIGGSGASGSVGTFSSINWGGGLKYLKVEVDVNGGTSFVTAGSTQLLSVPYALYAANAGADGKSAYQIWLDTGNVGTQADFLNSLKVVNQSAGGDLGGGFPNPQVVKIQGTSVSSIAPTVGQVLQFNGTSWVSASLPSLITGDVTTSQSDVISLNNASGAALKNLSINLKPGTANSYLITDSNQQVKWSTASDAKLVTGKLTNLTFSTLDDGTTAISANDVGKIKVTVTGAQPGDPVFVTSVGDETEYQVLASWVSAPNEVSMRLANYQPVPVTITGRQYKILVVQN